MNYGVDEKLDRGRYRRRLVVALSILSASGPKEAGRIARIESVLALDEWPPTLERYQEFCVDLGLRS